MSLAAYLSSLMVMTYINHMQECQNTIRDTNFDDRLPLNHIHDVRKRNEIGCGKLSSNRCHDQVKQACTASLSATFAVEYSS